jgi:hypothetical protein
MTSTTPPNCAVVFKAYSWDDFVQRQAERLAAVAGRLDFFVQIDETNGAVGPIPFDRVQRFTCADLEASGLPMRFGLGGVLWWNPDYAHYQFLRYQPNYDYYLFVEYDCVVQCSLENFVSRAAAKGADLVSSPITQKFEEWHWYAYQRDVYQEDEVKLGLLNITLHSANALRLLHQRRLAMAKSDSAGWPSSEVFVPTEIARAGMRCVFLAELGDIAHCNWFPPTVEDNIPPRTRDAFFHPVLDRRRYIASVLNNSGMLPAGGLKRALEGLPREEYAHLLWPAAKSRAIRRVRHKLKRLREQWVARYGLKAPAANPLSLRMEPSRNSIPRKA